MNPEESPLQSTSQAFDALIAKVTGWGESLLMMLPNAVLALVIVLISGIVARLAAGLAERLLRRAVRNDQLLGLIRIVTRILVLCGGVFLALSVLDLDKTVTSLLAGVGVVGLALGFAFQDIAANFMSGILLASNRPYEVGDWVKLAGFEGTVESVDLRSVTLRAFSGESVILPNKDVFQNPMINFRGAKRVVVDVGVDYDSDLDSVLAIAKEAIEPFHGAEGKNPDVHVVGFGGSSIDLKLRFWIPGDDPKGTLQRRTEAMIAVKKAFDANDIGIPFPIRTLQFDNAAQVQLEEPRAAK